MGPKTMGASPLNPVDLLDWFGQVDPNLSPEIDSRAGAPDGYSLSLVELGIPLVVQDVQVCSDGGSLLIGPRRLLEQEVGCLFRIDGGRCDSFDQDQLVLVLLFGGCI